MSASLARLNPEATPSNWSPKALLAAQVATTLAPIERNGEVADEGSLAVLVGGQNPDRAANLGLAGSHQGVDGLYRNSKNVLTAAA